MVKYIPVQYILDWCSILKSFLYSKLIAIWVQVSRSRWKGSRFLHCATVCMLRMVSTSYVHSCIREWKSKARGHLHFTSTSSSFMDGWNPCECDTEYRRQSSTKKLSSLLYEVITHFFTWMQYKFLCASTKLVYGVVLPTTECIYELLHSQPPIYEFFKIVKYKCIYYKNYKINMYCRFCKIFRDRNSCYEYI